MITEIVFIFHFWSQQWQVTSNLLFILNQFFLCHISENYKSLILWSSVIFGLKQINRSIVNLLSRPLASNYVGTFPSRPQHAQSTIKFRQLWTFGRKINPAFWPFDRSLRLNQMQRAEYFLRFIPCSLHMQFWFLSQHKWQWHLSGKSQRMCPRAAQLLCQCKLHRPFGRVQVRLQGTVQRREGGRNKMPTFV